MRILFVTKYVAGGLPGEFKYHGEWTDTFELVLALRRISPELQLWILTPGIWKEHKERFYQEFGQVLKANNIEHIEAPTYLDFSIPAELFRWQLFTEEVRIIKRLGIEVLQYGQFGLNWSYLLKEGLGLKKIIAYGCYDTTKNWPGKDKDQKVKLNFFKNSRQYNRLKVLLLKAIKKMTRLQVFDPRVDHFVLMHPKGYELLKEKYPELNISLIPKGYGKPPIDFNPKTRTNPKKVLFVGLLQYRKGVADLLKVAKELPQLEFNIAGAGTPEILNEMKQISMGAKNIHFLGPVNYRDKWMLYKENDIFVLPSYKDTYPSVVLEAMAAALPVITTYEIDTPVIHNKNGILFHAGDITKLKESLNLLTKDLNLYEKLSSNALKTSMSLTWDHAAREFLKLYRDS